MDLEYAGNHAHLDLSGEKIGVATCKACSHQFISPCPTAVFLAAFYGSYMSAAKNGFYKTRQTEKIPDAFRNYYGNWLDRIRILHPEKSYSILDIGCGLGMFLRLAKEYGFMVRGLEPNAEAADMMQKRYSIQVYNLLLENYAEGETFDIIIMWDLLEHLAQPKIALQKISRMLNENGLLVLEIPVRDSMLHWAAKGLYRLSFGLLERPLFLTYGIHHLQYFSEESIKQLLYEHGFYVLETHRKSTSLTMLMREGGAMARLYNITLHVLFCVASLTGKNNKLVVFARLKTHG